MEEGDLEFDEGDYAPEDPLLISLRRREKTRRRQKRRDDSEQRRVYQVKAELRAKSSHSMPSYEELCQRYQETLALCSSSQSLFDLFSVDPLTSSLGVLRDSAGNRREGESEDSEGELFVADNSPPSDTGRRKRKLSLFPVTESTYRELLSEYKKERKLRRLCKDPKELRIKRKYEALAGLLDDETVVTALSKPVPPDVDTLRKTFKRQKKLIKIDPTKYLFTSQEEANNYLDVDELFEEKRYAWQFEEDNGFDLQFLEKPHRSGAVGRKTGDLASSVATLSWTPDKENFNTIWMVIVKRDIPKAHRQYVSSHGTILANSKKLAFLCQKEARRKVALSMKLAREAPHRAKKIAREMTTYWRKYDRDEREAKKRREIEDRKKRKEEEEIREANRQQRKLNYLLTQTELFSYFIGKKMEGAADLTPPPSVAAPAAMEGLPNEADDLAMQEEAGRNALAALDRQMGNMKAFDDDMRKLRAESELQESLLESPRTGEKEPAPIPPTAMSAGSSTLEQGLATLQHQGEQDGGITLVPVPKIFRGKLKQYQRRGLSWLVNLYEQGINGILADEMGLGKTVQSIAFLTYLAEVKNIWGPFLVLAPTSTLHNWQQEITKFCPQLKVLPYWGTAKDRKVIRKYWNPAHLYSKQSPFHVLITNYNLVVRDEKYFHRIKWEYMVLDEAQAIKSSSSSRWRSLLLFQCRNRLLLTGTPIQNSMAELWALLHFIMPTLFDSHQEFTEWFSKDIESHAENKSALNEHQLSRLHLILKPFMLRRLKQDVESEMPKKLEIEVMCGLSTRQKALYTAIKEKISVTELLSKPINSESDVDLMNLVMQFRKVCNHPELFERAEYTSPFVFGLPSGRGNDNPISFTVPRTIFEMARVQQQYSPKSTVLSSLFDIFEPSHVHQSLFSHGDSVSSFSFIRFMNISPMELARARVSGVLEQWMDSQSSFHQRSRQQKIQFLQGEQSFAQAGMFSIRPIVTRFLHPAPLLPRLCPTSPGYRHDQLKSVIHTVRRFVPSVAATPVSLYIPGSRRASWLQHDVVRNQQMHQLLLGFHYNTKMERVRHGTLMIKNPPEHGTLLRGLDVLLDRRRLWVPDRGQLIADSGKLRVLDELLTRLKAEGHRVLCYSQMTKMIDILEDFMAFRKHRYIRLDGSSKLSERRDMVEDFQTNPNIFMFLLSTRAGGLGINLTSADTVIFYDSDWNPTNDAQAMDRAHRIGQTEQVTVYRLLTKDTVEERILHRAQEKNKIQALVITGGKFDRATLKPKEVVSLLGLST